MSPHEDEQQIARQGLEQIETAILSLLDRHPEGLRNAQIAEFLDLRSNFRGRQKDYLTYSVLGGLLHRGNASRSQRHDAGNCFVRHSAKDVGSLPGG